MGVRYVHITTAACSLFNPFVDLCAEGKCANIRRHFLVSDCI
jgi:hypothetical protein